jgi:hypothetical protein
LDKLSPNILVWFDFPTPYSLHFFELGIFPSPTPQEQGS